jgi:hypothetical protein
MLFKNCVLAIQKRNYEQEKDLVIPVDDNNEWMKMMQYAISNSRAKPVLLKCMGWLIEAGIWNFAQGISNWLQRNKIIAVVSNPIKKMTEEAIAIEKVKNGKHDLCDQNLQRLRASLNAVKALYCALTLGISNAALQRLVSDVIKAKGCELSTFGHGFSIPLGVGLGDKTRSNLTEPPLLWDLNLKTKGKRGELYKQTVRSSKRDVKFDGTPPMEQLIKMKPDSFGTQGGIPLFCCNGF